MKTHLLCCLSLCWLTMIASPALAQQPPAPTPDAPAEPGAPAEPALDPTPPPVAPAQPPAPLPPPPPPQDMRALQAQAEGEEDAAEPQAPPIRGQVLSVEGKRAIISVGTQQGVKRGMLLQIYREERGRIDLDGDVLGERVIGFARVVDIGPKRASLELKLNQAVSPGDLVRDTTYANSATLSLFSPSTPRPDGVTSAHISVRPFLPINSLGFGAILDATLRHHFEIPFTLALHIQPLGLTFTKNGNVATFASNLIFSFDSDLFEIGVGAGISRFSEGGDTFSPGASPPRAATTFAFAAAQHIRLGTLDGFHFTLRTLFLAINNQWDFGGVQGSIQVPINGISRDSWLIFRGSNSAAGETVVESGLRLLVSGNGREGSLFLTPTFGFGGLSVASWYECQRENFDSPTFDLVNGYCPEREDYFGLLFGLSVESRF